MYEATEAAPASPIVAKPAALPAETREELEDAVESLDSERIAAIVTRIGQADAELGSLLDRQAKVFDYPAAG